MQVPITAYAEDCSLTGELTLTADRLSDFLTSTFEFGLDNVVFRALDDGHIVVTDSTAIQRADLCVVIAAEPRGREELRIWTRQFPVRARVGPYDVRGYVHAPPTIDPLKLPARRPIVALTSASVRYTEAGTDVEFEAETVLVNSAWIGVLEPATTTDIDASALDDGEDIAELTAADVAARLGDASARELR